MYSTSDSIAGLIFKMPWMFFNYHLLLLSVVHYGECFTVCIFQQEFFCTLFVFSYDCDFMNFWFLCFANKSEYKPMESHWTTERIECDCGIVNSK